MNRTVVVEPTGEHATIDTDLARDALSGLLDADAGVRRRTADLVLAEPERCAPPVLTAVSEVLLELGRPADAAFCFYAGQLRARVDADRCTDATAGAAVAELRERFGGPVARYAFTDLDRLRRNVIRVLVWDRATPRAYDHRWIALHGMSAFLGSSGPLSVPEDEWEARAARTRATWLTDFRHFLRELRA